MIQDVCLNRRAERAGFYEVDQYIRQYIWARYAPRDALDYVSLREPSSQ